MHITSKIKINTNIVGLVALSLAIIIPLSGCVATEKKLTKDQFLTKEPVLNKQLSQEDFAFPSRPPKLSLGQTVFTQNCATCHTASSMTYDKIKDTRPIDTYLMLTRGDHGHPTFPKLTRDQRWEAIFYARYLAGGADIKNKDVASIFGSNCAVCHGAKGFADGPLFTGHPAAHELGLAPIKDEFDPPPANFHSYSRMYNRTDDQLVKFISEGVYPSAMPSWLGREDLSKGVVFNESLIRDLVKYVRQFSYEDDLPASSGSSTTSAKPAGKKSKLLSAAIPGAKLSKSEKH